MPGSGQNAFWISSFCTTKVDFGNLPTLPPWSRCMWLTTTYLMSSGLQADLLQLGVDRDVRAC